LFKVLQVHSSVAQKGIDIKYMGVWVPAHVEFEGNEAAYVLAKKALLNEEVQVEIK